MKPTVLRAAILETLSGHEELMSERHMMLELSVEYRAKITFSELREALRALDEAKHITGVRSHLDEAMQWSISTLGKAWLAELR